MVQGFYPPLLASFAAELHVDAGPLNWFSSVHLLAAAVSVPVFAAFGDLMLEKGTSLVPTFSAALRVPDPALVPAYLYEKKVRWSAKARENIAKAIAAGVKIALGTDAGVCPHGRNLLELSHLVELGMTPSDAIAAGTANAAELLGLADEAGTLEPGKAADLVVVSGDPLRDISVLADPESIELVVQEGKAVKDLLPAEAPGLARSA
ncbi:amidohydrolase family protein [Amycolatopsis nivea]